MPDSPAAPRQPGPDPPAGGDDTAVPLEVEPRLGTPPGSPASHPPAAEDDFQFILCERCRKESPNLKLLTCLHTLCLGCLSEMKPVGQCPICRTAIPQASGIPDMDNLLFTNLQARLNIYKKISESGGPGCSRCQGERAAVWCEECEELLCTKCFEDHQWFFKKRSHEAKRVEELRADSAHRFLEDTRKSCNLFCSSPGHANQGHISSIYCRTCQRALCCSCALLDSHHAFCDIPSETRRRQEELGTMRGRLQEKRRGLEATYAGLQAEAARLERGRQEMRELIRQRVEQLVGLVRREEEELLGLVEAGQEQGRRELARELERVEGVLRRMEAGERLVEQMNLYATEQEVMDMQPFIKDSLEELQRLQLPVVKDQKQPGDLAKCRARLQVLEERVMGHPGPHSRADTNSPTVEVAPENNLQEEPVEPENQSIVPTFTISLKEMHTSSALPITSCPKRTSPCVGIQTSPKLLKLECDSLPSPSHPSSNQRDSRRGTSTSELSQNCSPTATNHANDAEDASIVISSSEDSSEEDTALKLQEHRQRPALPASVARGCHGATTTCFHPPTQASSKPKVGRKPYSPTWSGSGTSPHCSTRPTSPWDDGSELSTLVFLSVKVDQKTHQIMEVAAVNGEHTFRTLIQTPESVLPLVSQGVSMEVGMQNLLWYLSVTPRPILILYNFWAPELPALFKALDATGRKKDFCHVVAGYVDMLSLLKEKLPKAPSYRLKGLLRRHLQQQLNEGSALATAKALQDLWGALELPVQPAVGVVLTHCNLQSYTILRPLVREKLLTRRVAKILAQRNIILWELEKV